MAGGGHNDGWYERRTKSTNLREAQTADDDGQDESEKKDEQSERYQQPPDPPVAGPVVRCQRRIAALSFTQLQRSATRQTNKPQGS